MKKQTESPKSTKQTLTILDVMSCKFVKSHYSARWKGVVIDKKNRTGYSPLYLILVLKDSNGNIPRKRMVKILDSGWTTEINRINLDGVNTRWFNELPTL